MVGWERRNTVAYAASLNKRFAPIVFRHVDDKPSRKNSRPPRFSLLQVQKDIGDEKGCDEFAEIAHKIKKTKLSKEAREKATHELKKLRQISPQLPRLAAVEPVE